MLSRTPANRHISFPFFTSVRMASSPTQVTSLVPSCAIATGPPVYNGATTFAFLNLYPIVSSFIIHKIHIHKETHAALSLLRFSVVMIKRIPYSNFILSETELFSSCLLMLIKSPVGVTSFGLVSLSRATSSSKPSLPKLPLPQKKRNPAHNVRRKPGMVLVKILLNCSSHTLLVFFTTPQQVLDVLNLTPQCAINAKSATVHHAAQRPY